MIACKQHIGHVLRIFVAASAAPVFAIFVAGGVSAQDAAAPAQPAAGDQEMCWAAPQGGGSAGENAARYVLGVGDRLKISLYQRPDLSGEFQVREDGRISMPLLGLVKVEGMDLVESEKAVAAAFEAAAGIPTSVSLEVAQRRPFYVIGYVNVQGAHPYTQGLTVLRAIALSGGLFRPGLNMGPAVDVSREAARLGQADAELKRNLARHARLVAERDGKTTLEAPQRLVDIASPIRVEELMAAERRLMEQRNAAFESEVKGRSATLELVKEQITALEDQHKALLQQVELARNERAISEDLLSKGLSRRGDLLTLQRVMANLEADERDLVARIARAKIDLATAERDQSLLHVNRALNLEQEINAVEAQIAAGELSISYSKRIIESLTSIPVSAQSSIRSSTLKYEIVRNTGREQKVLNATETTPLCPDDVLRVLPAPED